MRWAEIFRILRSPEPATGGGGAGEGPKTDPPSAPPSPNPGADDAAKKASEHAAELARAKHAKEKAEREAAAVTRTDLAIVEQRIRADFEMRPASDSKSGGPSLVAQIVIGVLAAAVVAAVAFVVRGVRAGTLTLPWSK